MAVSPTRTTKSPWHRQVASKPVVAFAVSSTSTPVTSGHVLPRLALAYKRLLQVTGVCNVSGWLPQLYFVLIYGIITVPAFKLLRSHIKSGQSQLAAKHRLVDVLTNSNFFGAIFFIMWLTVTITFLRNRRKYGEILADIETALLGAMPLRQRLDPANTRFRRQLLALHALTAITCIPFITCIFVMSVMGHLHLTSFQDMLLAILETTVYCMYMICFLMTAFKFIFAGLLISSGFQTCNAQLRAMSDQEAATQKNGKTLYELGQLQLQLTNCFNNLTSGICSEVVLTMLYGVSMNIMLVLAVFTAIDIPGYNFLHFVTAGMGEVQVIVILTAPCETTHYVRGLVGEGQKLLLQLQLQQPWLASEVAALMAVGQHSLDTLGDLGLYRLSRSTLVAVNSTMVTYLVVMQQFRLSGLVPAENDSLDPTLNFTLRQM